MRWDKIAMSISSDADRRSGVIQPSGYMTARRVLGYVRVSKETEAGLSLAAQATKIRAIAEVKDVPLADVFVDDGASAKSLDRPELQRLLALVDARQVTTVIIAKLDRLTRSIADLCALLDRFEAREVSLVSVAESLDTRSSAGRLVVHIMGSVADWERREIGIRTKDVLSHKRSQGERIGTLPFGSQLSADGTHLEPAPLEQRVLDHIQTLKAASRSTRAIAAELNAAGARTRRGTAWRHQYVARVLKVVPKAASVKAVS
jgi:site-specific DNA recombinase